MYSKYVFICNMRKLLYYASYILFTLHIQYKIPHIVTSCIYRERQGHHKYKNTHTVYKHVQYCMCVPYIREHNACLWSSFIRLFLEFALFFHGVYESNAFSRAKPQLAHTLQMAVCCRPTLVSLSSSGPWRVGLCQLFGSGNSVAKDVLTRVHEFT